MVNFPENKKVILFDGVCDLCNSAIQTVIKNDESDVFRFTPLQSDIGLQIVNERGIDTENIDSLILLEPGEAYYCKSDAVIEIAKHLKGYKWLKYTKPVPQGLRDGLYGIVAKNRYQWFGKKEECMVPTPKLQEKFLK